MSGYKVNVKHLTDKVYSFDVNGDTTVLQLKHQIEGVASLPAGEIKLICKGKILKNDTDTLKDLNIGADTTILMIHQKPQTEAEKAQASAPQTPQTSQPSAPQPPQANPFASFQGGMGGMGGLGGFEGLDAAGLEGLGDLGGMGGMGGMGGINPAQIQQLMSNPQVREGVQNLMQNPEMLRGMIQNNPMLRNMTQNNPMMQQMLNDPQMMSNMMNMAFGGALGNPAPQGAQGAQGAQPPQGGAPNFANLFGGLGAQGAQGGANPLPQMNFGHLLNNPGVNPNLPPEERFKDQLEKLSEMGFTNKALNIQVLEQVMGNVDAAVEKLLSLMS